jgi:hypothetical protein
MLSHMKILRDSSSVSILSGACLALFVAISCGKGSDTNNGGSGGSDGGNSGSKGGSGGSKSTGKTGGTSGAQCDKLSPIAGMKPVSPLIMSEIRPGESIEIYNTTTATIDLAMTPKWYLCAYPYYLDNTDISGLTDKTSIPAGGTIKLNWPPTWHEKDMTALVPGVEKGEMLLYTGGLIPLKVDALKDYICWGTHTEGRKDKQTPHAVGAKIWSGDCVAAPTNGSITRKPDTSGEDKDSYDTTAEDGVKDCP